MTNTVMKVKMPLFVMCQHWCMKFKPFLILITVAHHDRSIHERVITRAEEVGSAIIAGELYSVLKSTAGA